MVDQAGGGFSNEFRAVLPNRIAFNVKKSWFSGAIQEEYAIRHITSVRSEISRSVAGGVICLLLGLAGFATGGSSGMLVGVLLIGFAIILLIGSPSVTINTAGGERRTSRGTPFQRAAGDEYAAAVRQALFSE